MKRFNKQKLGIIINFAKMAQYENNCMKAVYQICQTNLTASLAYLLCYHMNIGSLTASSRNPQKSRVVHAYFQKLRALLIFYM